MTQPETASIMVVDDQPVNLKLLEAMMKNQGYAIRSFPRGRLALASAAQSPPDLILLDINMPEMDGFEVCQRLKSDPRLARIPVIFLSALSDTEDKIKAFQSGGVDYVTKPFHFAEVQARVETHLELHRLQRAAEQQNQNLEELVRARTRELGEAHARLKMLDESKNDFLLLISHELRTPLNGILGITELVWNDLESGQNLKLRQVYQQSRKRLLEILDHALLLTQINVQTEKFVCVSVPLAGVLTAAIKQVVEFASLRQVRLECTPAARAAFIPGRHDLLVTALRALLETAVKLSESGGTVQLACDYAPDAIQIAIESHGQTVPPPAIPKFFELFAIGEHSTPAGQLGLDPAVAQRILALFGGSVTIENRQPPGTKLTISLKATPD